MEEDYKTLIGMKQDEIDAYKDFKQTQGVASFMGGFADSIIDYNALKINASFGEASADRIELQAEQKANAMREEFNSAVGNAKYSATRRGITSDSGSVKRNVETSSENIGYNISTMKKNAKNTADDIRNQSKLAKKQAKSGMIQGLIGGGVNLYNSSQTYKK